jgi:hypothetical protein
MINLSANGRTDAVAQARRGRLDALGAAERRQGQNRP